MNVKLNMVWGRCAPLQKKEEEKKEKKSKRQQVSEFILNSLLVLFSSEGFRKGLHIYIKDNKKVWVVNLMRHIVSQYHKTFASQSRENYTDGFLLCGTIMESECPLWYFDS